eukprot:gnl/Chilomastix_cuspidata/1551.p1 GENE.gnl/Chilomastix_cuspidata/1551~~gnl/Chilomastix_cuspidata/1551.p1  ORF type:complete len:393 (+),score=149.08 gnl/Chilomastix_cuspidata/1551:84-1262(+)
MAAPSAARAPQPCVCKEVAIFAGEVRGAVVTAGVPAAFNPAKKAVVFYRCEVTPLTLEDFAKKFFFGRQCTIEYLGFQECRLIGALKRPSLASVSFGETLRRFYKKLRGLSFRGCLTLAFLQEAELFQYFGALFADSLRDTCYAGKRLFERVELSFQKESSEFRSLFLYYFLPVLPWLRQLVLHDTDALSVWTVNVLHTAVLLESLSVHSYDAPLHVSTDALRLLVASLPLLRTLRLNVCGSDRLALSLEYFFAVLPNMDDRPPAARVLGEPHTMVYKHPAFHEYRDARHISQRTAFWTLSRAVLMGARRGDMEFAPSRFPFLRHARCMEGDIALAERPGGEHLEQYKRAHSFIKQSLKAALASTRFRHQWSITFRQLSNRAEILLQQELRR